MRLSILTVKTHFWVYGAGDFVSMCTCCTDDAFCIWIFCIAKLDNVIKCSAKNWDATLNKLLLNIYVHH